MAKRSTGSAPQYCFVDFSNAERLPPIIAPLSNNPRPHVPSAQQDVHDLGVLFQHLISSSAPAIRSVLTNHFTLLISAMTEGGFTAEESRKLLGMISHKWEEGGRFLWNGSIKNSGNSKVEGGEDFWLEDSLPSKEEARVELQQISVSQNPSTASEARPPDLVVEPEGGAERALDADGKMESSFSLDKFFGVRVKRSHN